MLFASKKVFGLDIGTSSMKLADLSVKNGKGKLEGFYFSPTPAGAITGGEIVGAMALSTSITEFLGQVAMKLKNCSASVWGTGVVVKKISVPRMDLKLLEEQIKFEAEQYIPFDLDEVNIEYHVLKKQIAAPDSMEILLVAAKKSVIMGYAEAIESAGLNCSVLDVSGFALANCFEFNYPRPDAKTIGLLNIGASCCNFVVLENREPIFLRDIPVGGLNYTSDIQKQMGISPDEAESLKVSASGGEATPPEVQQILQSTNETVAEEIQRSVEFFAASTGNQSQIQRYYISGGCIQVPNLLATIEKSLGVRVERLNPFINISYNRSQFTPEYMTQIAPYAPIAVGLSLRKAGDSK